ncbi:MAG: hypothetical protein OEX02_00745 [Cyclobacteriaceae bacterium]|nr:hypothetical protein [Cyclobacteriaceae bacterium]
MKSFVWIVFCLGSFPLFSQSDSLKIFLPEEELWNVKDEGQEFSFTLRTSDSSAVFDMMAPSGYGMQLDSFGNFTWRTDKNLVMDDDGQKQFYIQFFAKNNLQSDTVFVELVVKNVIQESPPLEVEQIQINKVTEIRLPRKPGWNLIREGDSVQFKISAETTMDNLEGIKFYFEEGEESEIEFDSLGNFSWTVPYTLVDRFQQTIDKHVFFMAEDQSGNIVSQKVILTIFHKNQKPIIGSLSPFYVLSGANNTYQITSDFVSDPDDDPIVFITTPTELPQGMEFTSGGKITWNPSRKQFTDLRTNGIKVPFYVEDQPAKQQTRGFLQVNASNQDMPPEVIIIPGDSVITVAENSRIHLVFHLSDPNGDEDLNKFNFYSDHPGVSEKQLVKNTETQYEFLWTPGFQFVNDPEPFLEVQLRFVAIDNTSRTTTKTLKIKVVDTEDLSIKDRDNYISYREILTNALNLTDQLSENQKELDKELKQAKKGKRNRTLINASLGLVTGLSPVIAGTNDDAQKTISVIGGTSTATLGTLEAKNILGKSVDGINDKIKLNAELYNQFISEGTGFARRYNTKAQRRNTNFSYDLEKFKNILNTSKLATLQLDAGWENKKKVNSRRLKSAFADFDASEVE